MPQTTYRITYTDAKELMKATISSAIQNYVSGAVAIVDHGGNIILVECLDQTMSAAASIAVGKAATAVAFKRPTKDIENVILEGRSPMLALDAATALPYVPLKGGYPIWYEGEVIGGIAAAGTMDADMDEVVVLQGLKETGWVEKKDLIS